MSTWRCAVWLLPVALFAGTGLAQVMPRGRAMHQHYDAAKETTIQATVEDTFTGTGRMRGVVWKIKAEDRELTVYLGPASYLEAKKFTVAVGDAVTVTGAPLPNRPDVIVAREVKAGNTVLTLRDKEGRPEWAGPRWRGSRRSGPGWSGPGWRRS